MLLQPLENQTFLIFASKCPFLKKMMNDILLFINFIVWLYKTFIIFISWNVKDIIRVLTHTIRFKSRDIKMFCWICIKCHVILSVNFKKKTFDIFQLACFFSWRVYTQNSKVFFQRRIFSIAFMRRLYHTSKDKIFHSVVCDKMEASFHKKLKF